MGKVVVIGGTGVVGAYAARRFAEDGGLEVVTVSRRAPSGDATGRHVAVDLLDADASARTLSDLTDVECVVYAGYLDRPSMAELVAPNLAMLVNAVAPIAAASPDLKRVVLIEGTKAYGSHLGPFETPAKESDPRILPPMFYYDQQDWLRAQVAEGARWSWTALRPQTVCGFALGVPMNLTLCIAAYGAICREFGVPMRFPGKPGAWDALYQVTDSAQLAAAIHWAATATAAANAVFNITNGDYFRWRRVWPKLAAALGCAHGDPFHINLTDTMADKGPVWDRMVAREGLQPHALDTLANWKFADYVFATEWDVMSSMTKIRQAGFTTTIDSEDMFARMFDEFRAMRVIPPA